MPLFLSACLWRSSHNFTPHPVYARCHLFRPLLAPWSLMVSMTRPTRITNVRRHRRIIPLYCLSPVRISPRCLSSCLMCSRVLCFRPLAAGLLGKLDYIGSISGSSWFTNLLGYDEEFFNQLKETSTPIGQVVSEFGDRWEQKMSAEHASWRDANSFSSRVEAIEQFFTSGSGFNEMEVRHHLAQCGSRDRSKRVPHASTCVYSVRHRSIGTCPGALSAWASRPS